ncbi:hypothetical protein TRFO_08739 [Tritrichomonas foetus]|uniref:Uncharacterized protein n=1 Tax=Tritrichomonas foetus TaxID=1144522 RepID=A0A1J4JHY9_9EUKA|nr:hypothetical protein TRFO_08739 [Tritrichomonas foetus]|eukprot:OHS98734.1 hypothetical protein TRFO_08739 [Tritrichomonas foetus]
MFFLYFASVYAIDAKTVLVGTWSVYPGSARSYSPQLKYNFVFHNDDYEQFTYATAWEPGKVPTDQTPNPPLSALKGEAKLYFQGLNRGLYVAGEDRHWRSFAFNDVGGKKICNVSTKSGYKFGIYIQSDKTMEVTAVAPNGTIVEQYLCFFKSELNTTALENYINKKNAGANPQAAEEDPYHDIDDDAEIVDEVEEEQYQVFGSQKNPIVSPVFVITLIALIVVFEIVLCSVQVMRKSY